MTALKSGWKRARVLGFVLVTAGEPAQATCLGIEPFGGIFIPWANRFDTHGWEDHDQVEHPDSVCFEGPRHGPRLESWPVKYQKQTSVNPLDVFYKAVGGCVPEIVRPAMARERSSADSPHVLPGVAERAIRREAVG
jgi:hypothetical protein